MKKQKLGVKISVTSSVIVFALAILTLIISSIAFAKNMISTYMTIVDSGIRTVENDINVETNTLMGMAKIFLAHGDDRTNEEITADWMSDRRSEYDFAAVRENGEYTWKSDNYELPADFTLSPGIHKCNGKLVCTYGLKDDDGCELIFGTDLANTDFVDNLKKQTDSEITLFIDNKRYSTTFTVGNTSERDLSLPMADDAWANIQKGEIFAARSVRLNGIPYFAQYSPIKDSADNSIIGAYFAGYSRVPFDIVYEKTVGSCMAFVLVVSAVVVFFLVKSMDKNIKYPVGALVPVCKDIEKIKLSNKNSDFSFNNDEIGELAQYLMQAKDTLNSYVADIVSILSEMAKGDFSKSSGVDYMGDFIEVQRAFQSIQQHLGDIIGNVAQSAASVSAGAEEMASGTQLLAEGTQRQAAVVEQLSSTVTEISENINKTAGNAKSAANLSSDCAAIMNKQTEKMNELISAMDIVEKKSEDIAHVIKTIEDIAFQTNILALNASVEAARAGAVGKGFAVVASEVGSLADKSAESAQYTRKIIDSTLSAVEESVRIAHDAAAAISNVTDKSEQASILVNEIADDSSAQALALEQATAGINDINMVIQQNSATAEESAASCRQLSSQAGILREQVKKLRV